MEVSIFNLLTIWVSLRHDLQAYLKYVLTRLPMHMNSRLEKLLPHHWTPV